MGKKSKARHVVFIEFARGHKPCGKVTIEVYHDLAPMTAQYFTGLITAKTGGYLGSTLSRVVSEGYICGGDLKDVPPTPCPSESFDRRHAHAGVLSLNASSCQFTITLNEAKHLDGQNVVIGQVTNGMDVITEIAKVPTDINERPRVPITIFACGVENQHDDDEVGLSKVQQFESRIQDQESQDDEEPAPQQTQFVNRRAELMLKMNQALKLNNKAVIDEQLRANDPHYERRKARQEYYENKGDQKGRDHLNQSAMAQQKYKKRDKPQKESFGWDMFNTDSAARAYDKRVNKMQKLFEGQAAGTSRADVMAREIEEITEKRNQYSRKRIEDDSKDVTSINERNKAYNKKLERNFSKYANEIKGSLERGTAM